MLYLMLGSLWYAMTIVSIWDHHIYVEHHQQLSFLLILNCTLFSCLVFFNLWNWWLALTGISTIEFWKAATATNADLVEQYDYRLDSPGDNLFLIFGTQKVLRMLSPSLRNVPLTGIEWSFL
jgi:hypothetical protein